MRRGYLGLGLVLLLVTPAIAENPESPLEGTGDSGPVPVQANFRADSLLWWMRGSPLPFPLGSRNANVLNIGPDGSVRLPGSLDQIGTESIHGTSINYGPSLGARFAASMWFDDYERVGFEASAFFLDALDSRIQASGDGSTGSGVLARPFFAPLLGPESAIPVAQEGLAAGMLLIQSRLDNFWGIDSHAGITLWREQTWHVDFLLGSRYQQIRDRMDVYSSSFFPSGTTLLPTPFTLGLLDQVSVQTRFYGGSLGLRGEWRWDRLLLQPGVKVALGVNHQEWNLNGSSTLTQGASSTTNTTGFLVQESNRGSYERDSFSVLTELNLNAAYQVTDHVRFTLGYSYLYWNNVPRAAQALDPNITVAQRLPVPGFPSLGDNGPNFQSRSTDFWAHGLNVGLELAY